MTDYDALMAAVLDRPDDDTPRLVLADWYDDHGDPERSEFIRVQVELARLIVRPLAEVMFCPRPANPNLVTREAVSGTLGGSPEGVVAGAVVDWTVAGGLDLADGFWAGVGVIEAVGQDRHGLTVRLRPIPNEGSRPDRDAARAKRRELRRRERELFERHKCEWFGDRWAILLLDDDDPDVLPGLAEAVVRRGFVDEIRLPLAAFVGGACGRCNARGGEDRYPEDDPTNRLMHGPHWYSCPDCSGTGRVPGLARELFAAHPLTKCVLTCREPGRSAQHSGMWRWYAARDCGSPYDLPHGIYELLKGEYPESRHGRARQPYWPTRADAMTALSDACVSFGRGLAGLRPLTAPTS